LGNDGDTWHIWAGKMAGVWREANVEIMLALRTVRANGKWDNYWGDLAEVT